MKPNPDHENDRGLDKVLKQWTVDAPLPPRFQEQVWKRIARTETRPAPAFWASLRHLMEVALPQPKFAFSYIAALLLLGIVGGSWAAQREANRLDATLGSRYLQSIDPYQKPALAP